MDRATSLIILGGMFVCVLAVGVIGLVVFLKIRKMNQKVAAGKPNRGTAAAKGKPEDKAD